MKHETPRTPDGAKLCAWCGGTMRQTGVGRSRDYCSRTHKEYAYRARRDQRLVDAALAAAAVVSTTAEKAPADAISPVVETESRPVNAPIPAPAAPEEDYLLAPPAPVAQVELPSAWKAAPAPAPRRQLGAGPGRRRYGMTAAAIPLPFDGLEDDEGL